MAKKPKNLPGRGDLVRRRGRPERLGRLVKMDDETNWCTAHWDDGLGPWMCHRFELERAE